MGTAPVAGTPSATAASSPAPFPANWQARRAAVAAKVGLDASPAAQAVARAIKPGDYACGPTDLDTYVGTLFSGMSTDQLRFLSESGVLDFPTYDALFFGTTADPAYALTPTYRQQLTGSFRDAKKFWDIQSGDIQLMAMHGEGVLQDPARLSRLLSEVYGLPPAQAGDYAKYVVTRVAEIPALKGGSNPIFTLNAFAFSGKGDQDPAVAALPDKLIFGDGILKALEYMKIGDVGPRAVLGHEFGHHVQYEDNLFDSPLNGPEATRRTADGGRVRHLLRDAQPRPLAQRQARLQAERTFYEVGDCAFDNPGHHGTPNQRVRASQWGADLANSAQKQGHILPSLSVAATSTRRCRTW